VKDAQVFDLVLLANGCYVGGRKSAKAVVSSEPAPCAKTTWETTYLDHTSFSVGVCKAQVAFYRALIGGKPTGDEGRQDKVWKYDDCGNVLLRGANSRSPALDRSVLPWAVIDHVSFGLDAFDPVAIAGHLTARGLTASPDIGISGGDAAADIGDATANYKNLRANAPHGYSL
jgi:hypothetical protein